MRKKVEWAIFLIVAAALIIIFALGLVPNSVEWPWLIALVLLGYLVVISLLKLNWGFFIPLSLIPYTCIRAGLITQDMELYPYVEKLTPWPLLIAAILLTIAFSILFKRKKRVSQVSNMDGKEHYESCEDGEHARLDNHFGSTTKYVNSDNLKRGTVDNAFGQANIYFDNAMLSPEGANIKVENSFGETNVYLPAAWRTQLIRDAAFGSVQEHGFSTASEQSPLVVIRVDNSFGEVNIYHN